jgi:hypothetical protein
MKNMPVVYVAKLKLEITRKDEISGWNKWHTTTSVT